jgi:ribosomal protein S18 acetylase RimI-like enzyme
MQALIQEIFPCSVVLARKGDIVFKAMLEGAAVGFAHLRLEKGTWRILGIGIREGFREKGLGNMVLGFAIAEIRRLGGNRITLLAKSGNPVAERMYLKAGFRKIGSWRGNKRMGLVLNN